MKSLHFARRAGISLLETLIAAAIASVVLALAFTASVMLQRSMLAADYHCAAQNDQVRASDYLSRDLRGATQVVVSREGQQVDVVRPATDSTLLQVNLRLPVLGAMLQLGNPPPQTQVRYTIAGSELFREENGVRTRIASKLSGFQVIDSGTSFRIVTSFTPQFSQRAASQAAKAFTSVTNTIARQ